MTLKLPPHGGPLAWSGFVMILIGALASFLGLDHRFLRYLDTAVWLTVGYCGTQLNYLSYLHSSSARKTYQKWFLLAFVSALLNILIRQFDLYAGIPNFPGSAQIFSLGIAICIIHGFLTMIPGKLSTTELKAAQLDISCLTIGILTLIIGLEFPFFTNFPPLTMSFLVAFPLVYLTAASLIVLVPLIGRLRMSWNHAVLLTFFFALGGGYITRFQLMTVQHQDTTGHSANYVISFIGFLTAISLATLSNEPSRNRLYQKFCTTALRFLPLDMGLIALVALGLSLNLNGPIRWIIDIGTLTTIVLSFIRQSLLIHEYDDFLQAETKLREQASYFNDIAEHTADIIFEIGVEKEGGFRYLSNNRAGREVAIKGGDFVGKRPHEFFPKEFADRFVFNYSQCARMGVPMKYEQQIPHLDGMLWVETALVPIKNELGQVKQIMGISRNISAYKLEMEASNKLKAELENGVRERTRELESAYREMESYSYSVSHDLRTPLRGIIGFCNILIEEYSEKLDATGRTSLDRMLKASRQVNIFIDDMLRFSKVSRGQLRVTTVNLSLLAEKVVNDLQASDPTRTAEFLIAPEMITTGDIRMILLALESLLANAWKYSSKKAFTRIEFGQLLEEKQITFYVKDNGIGFEMANADKLFKVFQRLHTDDDFEGAGIGLAIVARIIERHNGRIWAEGIPNVGATFYFTLNKLPLQ